MDRQTDGHLRPVLLGQLSRRVDLKLSTDLHLSAMAVQQCGVLGPQSRVLMLLLRQIAVGRRQFLTQKNCLRLHGVHLMIQICNSDPVQHSQ